MPHLHADAATYLVGVLDSLKLKLEEWYCDKFSWLFNCPYIAIGAFYSTLDGIVHRGKELLTKAIQEYDDAIVGGRGDRLHRVARRLFGRGSAIRQHADAWIAAEGDVDMVNFPHIYTALLEYALIMPVERRIEAIHAAVKSVGRRSMRGMGLPQICAQLREPDTIKLLRTSVEFEDFCVEHWRVRSV